MSCETIGELILAVMDGEASAEEQALVREHVASCPQCAREHAELFRAVSQLRGALKSPVSGESLRHETMRAIGEQRPGGFLRSPLRLRWEAAALLLLSLGLIVYSLMSSSPQSTSVSNEKIIATATPKTGVAKVTFPRKQSLERELSAPICGIGKPKQIVVASEQEWQTLVEQMKTADLQFPSVNFNERRVVAIFSGELRPRAEGKYLAPQISAVLETSDRVEIHYSFREMSVPENYSGALTPFVMGIIPRTEKTITFVQEWK